MHKIQGAGSARPQENHRANPNVAPFWPRPYRRSLGDGDMPWFAPGPSLRTHRVRPSDKSAFNAIPGPSPARPSRLRLAIPRRGGLRTPARKPSRQSKRCPFLPPANRTPQVITTCLGSPLARLCGRTECVPPRKLPLASSPACPARRPTLGLASSPRGGLRTPARKASRRPQDHPPFGHRPIAHPR